MARKSRRSDERGAVLIIAALAIVGVLILAGLVLDFGAARGDRQSNKSAADFASAAGVRALAEDDGYPRPFRGICEAYRYLVANDDEMVDLAGAVTTLDGAGSWADPCSGPPMAQVCEPNTQAGYESTWGVFTGTAHGGTIEVEIKSGYALPDPAFEEDAGRGDTGDPDLGGCDNLSVIVRERHETGFGALANISELTTRIRSVARAVIGTDDEDAVALLLLERRDCRVLRTTGGNALARVLGSGFRPGFIHADSDGSGSCPGGSRVLEGEDLVPSNGAPDPSILADDAPLIDPATGVRALSRISTPAVAANPGRAHTPWPDTIGVNQPVEGSTVGRAPVDLRYRANVEALDADVRSVLAAGPDSSWHVVNGAGCTVSTASVVPPPPVTKTKVWFDCDVTVQNGGILETADGVTDLVIDGSLAVNGGGVLHVGTDVRNVYIEGKASGSKIGVDVDGTFVANNAVGEPCPDQDLVAMSATIIAVKDGSFSGSNGTTTMCATFLFLMSGGGTVPGSDGTPPGDFPSYTGIIDVSGNGTIDWTAPNQITDRQPTDIELATTHKFEDLAFWTEASDQSDIGGSGGVSMTGVFFLPNANPFKINGSGGQVIDADAQFIARKLVLNGSVELRMVADPNNVVPVPIFLNSYLVR